jgi:D-glucosaminate-specific PTS system IID component
MVPVLKKVYPNREDFVEALQRHLIFFNTEGLVGTIILGMTVAMEEEKSLKPEAVSGESIVAFKSSLMGPVAGIGDTITWGTVKPLVFTIAMTASANGSAAGWFIMFLFVPITVAYSWFLMVTGYKLGRNAIVSMLESGWINKIIDGASILGLFMVGALSSSMVNFELGGTYMSAGQELSYQSIFDGIIPGLLPLAALMGIFFFVKKKKQKFGTLILGILVICLLLAAIGIV